jgi:hypothetical protein
VKPNNFNIMEKITRGMATDELKRWKKTLTYNPTHLDIFEAGVRFALKERDKPKKVWT